MKLQQQIALALRHRPLLAPMLLAAASALLVFLVVVERHDSLGNLIFWGAVVPHLGLVAVWLASGLRHWLRRLLLALVAVVALSVVFSVRVLGWGQLAGALTFFAAYTGSVFLGAAGVNLAFGYLRPTGEPLRFSTWQILVVMTMVAPVAAFLPHAEWPLSTQEVPIFLGMIGIPIVAWLNSRLMRSAWQYTIATLAFAGLFEVAYSGGGPDLHGFFALPAVTCCGWLWAMSVQPNAKRRLVARRRRRSISGAAARPPIGVPPQQAPEPAPETRLDVEA